MPPNPERNWSPDADDLVPDPRLPPQTTEQEWRIIWEKIQDEDAVEALRMARQIERWNRIDDIPLDIMRPLVGTLERIVDAYESDLRNLRRSQTTDDLSEFADSLSNTRTLDTSVPADEEIASLDSLAKSTRTTYENLQDEMARRTAGKSSWDWWIQKGQAEAQAEQAMGLRDEWENPIPDPATATPAELKEYEWKKRFDDIEYGDASWHQPMPGRGPKGRANPMQGVNPSQQMNDFLTELLDGYPGNGAPRDLAETALIRMRNLWAELADELDTITPDKFGIERFEFGMDSYRARSEALSAFNQLDHRSVSNEEFDAAYKRWKDLEAAHEAEMQKVRQRAKDLKKQVDEARARFDRAMKVVYPDDVDDPRLDEPDRPRGPISGGQVDSDEPPPRDPELEAFDRRHQQDLTMASRDFRESYDQWLDDTGANDMPSDAELNKMMAEHDAKRQTIDPRLDLDMPEGIGFTDDPDIDAQLASNQQDMPDAADLQTQMGLGDVEVQPDPPGTSLSKQEVLNLQDVAQTHTGQGFMPGMEPDPRQQTLPEGLNVAVAGSHKHDDPRLVHQALYDLEKTVGIQRLQVGSGNAARWATRWALANQKEYQNFAADWKEQGPRAGPQRARDWLGPHATNLDTPDILLVFEGGKGTAYEAEQATRSGIPTRELASWDSKNILAPRGGVVDPRLPQFNPDKYISPGIVDTDVKSLYRAILELDITQPLATSSGHNEVAPHLSESLMTVANESPQQHYDRIGTGERLTGADAAIASGIIDPRLEDEFREWFDANTGPGSPATHGGYHMKQPSTRLLDEAVERGFISDQPTQAEMQGFQWNDQEHRRRMLDELMRNPKLVSSGWGFEGISVEGMPPGMLVPNTGGHLEGVTIGQLLAHHKRNPNQYPLEQLARLAVTGVNPKIQATHDSIRNQIRLQETGKPYWPDYEGINAAVGMERDARMRGMSLTPDVQEDAIRKLTQVLQRILDEQQVGQHYNKGSTYAGRTADTIDILAEQPGYQHVTFRGQPRDRYPNLGDLSERALSTSGDVGVASGFAPSGEPSEIVEFHNAGDVRVMTGNAVEQETTIPLGTTYEEVGAPTGYANRFEDPRESDRMRVRRAQLVPDRITQQRDRWAQLREMSGGEIPDSELEGLLQPVDPNAGVRPLTEGEPGRPPVFQFSNDARVNPDVQGVAQWDSSEMLRKLADASLPGKKVPLRGGNYLKLLVGLIAAGIPIAMAQRLLQQQGHQPDTEEVPELDPRLG